jgi:hypothetical protein
MADAYHALVAAIQRENRTAAGWKGGRNGGRNGEQKGREKRVTGIEPATSTLARLRSSQLSYTRIWLA